MVESLAERLDRHLASFACQSSELARDDVRRAIELAADARADDVVAALRDAAELHLEAHARLAALDALEIAHDIASSELQPGLATQRALLLANVDRSAARQTWLHAARLHEQAGDSEGVARARYCAAFDLFGAELKAELAAAAAVGGDGWAARAEGRHHLLDARYEAAAACDERAMRTARVRGDRHLEALALGGLGIAYSNVGRARDAIVALRRAVRLASHVQDEQWLVLNTINLMEALAEQLQLADALNECAKLAEHARVAGLTSWQDTIAMQEALLLYRSGQVAEAALRSGTVFAAIDDVYRDPETVAMALLHARILVELGVTEEIDALVAEAHQACASYGFASFMFEARALRVHLALARGDAATALAALPANELDEPVPTAMLALALARAGVLLASDELAAAARQLAAGLDPDDGPAVRLVLRELRAIEDGAAAPADSARVIRHCARQWSEAGYALEALRGRVCAELVAGASGVLDHPALTACGHELRTLGAMADAARVSELVQHAEGARQVVTLSSLLGLSGCTRPLRVRSLRAGEPLQLDPELAYFVVSGRVLLTPSDDERSVALGIVGPGELLGDAAIVEGHVAREAVAVAEADSELATLPAAELRDALEASPQTAMRVLGHAVQRARQAEALAERLAAWTLQRRLAAVLVDLAAHYGRATLTGGIVLDRAFSQQYLASRTAVTREAIARAMGSLRQAGLVDMRGRRIVICDQAAIERIATGTSEDVLVSA